MLSSKTSRTINAVVTKIVEGLYRAASWDLAGIQGTSESIVTDSTVRNVLAVFKLVAGVSCTGDVVVAQGVVYGEQATLADVTNIICTRDAIVAEIIIHDG